MQKHTILLVDDDINILKSLKRLFYSEKGLEVLTAEDARSAVSRLNETAVDVLISDERMPQIEGHKLVQYVKKHYPDVIRIILTGYADTEAMRAAVNRGEVYRYLFKPWDDNELLVTVRNALKLVEAERKKNEYARKLEKLNLELEEKVHQRTGELEKALKIIKAQRDSTQNQLLGTAHFLDSVRTLIDKQSRNSSFPLEIRRVIARLGERLEIPSEVQKAAELSAYFYRISTFAESSDVSEVDLLSTALGGRGPELLEKSANLITSVLDYTELGDAILYSSENYSGSGKPKGLSGDQIPLAARLFRVAFDFQAVQVKRNFTEPEAAGFIAQHKESFYDPRIAEALYEMYQVDQSQPVLSITLDELQAGMVLAEDVYLDNGVLYLVADTKITTDIVKRLRSVSLERLFPLDKGRHVLVQKKGH